MFLRSGGGVSVGAEVQNKTSVSLMFTFLKRDISALTPLYDLFKYRPTP